MKLKISIAIAGLLVFALPMVAEHPDLDYVRIFHQHDEGWHEVGDESVDLGFGSAFEFVLKGYTRKGKELSRFDFRPAVRVAIGRDALSDDNSFGELAALGNNRFEFRAKDRLVRGLRVVIFDSKRDTLKDDFVINIGPSASEHGAAPAVARLEILSEEHGRMVAASDVTIPVGGQLVVVVRGFDKRGQEADAATFATKLELRGGKTFGTVSHLGKNRHVITAGNRAEAHIRVMAYVPETEINASFTLNIGSGR